MLCEICLETVPVKILSKTGHSTESSKPPPPPPPDARQEYKNGKNDCIYTTDTM